VGERGGFCPALNTVGLGDNIEIVRAAHLRFPARKGDYLLARFVSGDLGNEPTIKKKNDPEKHLTRHALSSVQLLAALLR